MISIRRWFAAKMMLPQDSAPSTDSSQGPSSSSSFSTLEGSSPPTSNGTTTTTGDRGSSRSHRHRRHHNSSRRRSRHHRSNNNNNNNINNSQGSSGIRSRTNHSSSGFKLPSASSEEDRSTLLKFYYADEELNVITAELDSFDGRKDPVRCTNLVNQLRSAQDKVICLLFQLMDEWTCTRADRDYRLKFPDDLVAGGENGESLNGQIWFGAECLASGSNIMNHESESEQLRPMAKMLTNTLEQLRLELRHGILDFDTSFFIFTHPHPRITNRLKDKLQSFDILFSNFEYEYVKAMLPIKTADEIEKLHELTALFSEAVAYSLKKGLIAQSDLDECHPHVLIAIPRLAIMYGLVHCHESPIYRHRKDQLSSIFRQFYGLMHRVRELISALRPIEVEFLEKMLTNEESALSPHPPPPTASESVLNTTSPTLVSLLDSSGKKTTNDRHNREDESRLLENLDGVPDYSSIVRTTARGRISTTPHTSNYYGTYSHSYPQNHASSSVSPTSNRDSTSVHFRTPSVNQRRRQRDGEDEEDAEEEDEDDTPGGGMRASSSVKERTCSSSVGFTRMHRRRHSDPVESVHLDRRGEFMLKEGELMKDSSTSSLSLITTLKELRTRASGRMSLDPEHEHPRRNSRHHQMVHDHDVSSVSALDNHRQSCISFLSPSPAVDDVAVIHDQEEDEDNNTGVNQRDQEDDVVTLKHQDDVSLTSESRASFTNNTDANESRHRQQNQQPSSILKQKQTSLATRLSIVSSSCSSTSTSSSSPNDSVDSFELALAVAAKSSQYISPTTRQLLHKLYVTISGVADQLQSNSAADLRVILRHVFKMYTTPDTEEEEEDDDEDVFVDGEERQSSKKKRKSKSKKEGGNINSSDDDDVSVEEALEAREDAASSSTTSSLTSPVISNIAVTDSVDPSLPPEEPEERVSSTTTSPASSAPDSPSDDSLAEQPSLVTTEPNEETVISLTPVVSSSGQPVSARTRSSRVSFDVPSSSSDSERDVTSSHKISIESPETINENTQRQELSLPVDQPLIDLRDDSELQTRVEGIASSSSHSNHVQPIYVRRRHRHRRTAGIEDQQQFNQQQQPHHLVLDSSNSSNVFFHQRNHHDCRNGSNGCPSSTCFNDSVAGETILETSSSTDTITGHTPSSAGYFRPRTNDEQRMFNRRRVQSEGNNHNEISSGSSFCCPDHSHPCQASSVTRGINPPSIMAPIWVPDELVASCTSCDQTFTLLRRRHHCRSCGQIFCNQCSSHSVPLQQFGYNKPVRVCDRCFLTLRTIQALNGSQGNDLTPVFYPSSSSSPTLSSDHSTVVTHPYSVDHHHFNQQPQQQIHPFDAHSVQQRQRHLHLLQQQQQLPSHLIPPAVMMEYYNPDPHSQHPVNSSQQQPTSTVFTTITQTPSQTRISMTPSLVLRPTPPTHLLD